jgi:biotin carboxylase
MSEYKNYIVCIASEFKGNDFLEECQEAGWNVTLVTKNKLLNEPWAWTSLNNVKTVDDHAKPEDYVRAITNIAGGQPVHRVVGLDEFDQMTAAYAREHLQLGGMSSSQVIRFRDKLTMRNIASGHGINCPEFVGAFNSEAITKYLASVPAPWVVKPRHEVSAFGIRKCETKEQVWDVLSNLDNRNTWRDHPSQYLIEHFIVGDVYHVDSIVNDGKVLASGISKYGKPPFSVTHGGGVFTTATIPYNAPERRELEKINDQLLKAFSYQKGVTHAEFLHSAADGKFYLLEVACRVGGAYIANVHDYASGFNLWREWARLEIATPEKAYKLPKLRKEFAGVILSLAKTDEPDTSAYDDKEIVYRVKKKKHVGMIVCSKKYERVQELLNSYAERIAHDFLDVAPAREHYDD